MPLKTYKRRWDTARCLYAAAGVLFGLAGYLTYGAITSPAPESTPQGETASVSKTTLIGNPIRDTQLGWRVLGRNPLREQVDESLPEPDPETWRKITLRMTKADGHCLDIELLRPLFWLDFHEAEPGSTIFLDLPEMGAQGEAEVTSITACPQIEPDDGRGRPIVTGKFIHQSANVIDLHLDGLEKPIGCTANHPFWSEDRQEFIEAAELEQGEYVHTRLPGPIRVTRIAPRPGKHPVYNLEIHGEHVYEVSRAGVLVHNAYPRFWTSTKVFRGNKVFQRSDLFDPAMVSSWKVKGKVVTGTNLQRMASGRAPIGHDGMAVNLHHLTQRQSGAIAEVAGGMHQTYYGTLHINTGRLPSGIQRADFDKWRKNYWIMRALVLQ